MKVPLTQLPCDCQGPAIRSVVTKRRGMILIYTLLVIAGLVAGVFAFSEWMTLEYRATRAATDQVRCLEMAQGCVDLALAQLSSPSQNNSTDTNTLQSTWTDATGETYVTEFRGGAVGTPWGSIPHPINEGAKLNLNSLDLSLDAELRSRQRLMMIPGIDAEVADSILDWLDEDEEPRAFGAETSWYGSLGRRSRSGHGPLQELHELLNVRGVTPAKLYGEDVNGNGWLDLNEDDGLGTLPADNADGQLQAGWSQWLTVLSKESHLDRRGNPKINVNQTDLVTLYRQVDGLAGSEAARFIVALRMNGSLDDIPETQSDESDSLQRRIELAERRAVEQTRGTKSFSGSAAERFGDFVVDRPGRFMIQSLADLIGQRVEVTLDSQNSILRSPWSGAGSEVLSQWDWLQQHFCLAEQTAPGRIHLDYADRTVLMTIPGMTIDLAQRILSKQARRRAAVMNNEAWLVAENVMSLAKFRRMAPYFTSQGETYSGIAIAGIAKQPHRYAVSFMLDCSGRNPVVGRMELHADRPVPASWSNPR